jgi:hypothetical protein
MTLPKSVFARFGLGLAGLIVLVAMAISSQASPPTPLDVTPRLYLPVVMKYPGFPTVGGCGVFPVDNAWNADISGYSIHPNSAQFVADINGGSNKYLHADFGSDSGTGELYGIPYVVVPNLQSQVPINFIEYGSESDPGPYPIPANAPVEGGSDRHVLVVQSGACRLYELYHAQYVGPPGVDAWNAGSGAKWDLNSNALRPEGWTSADAAGLPILPGLARYDEATVGAINHALRFTARCSSNGHIHPATHDAAYNTSLCPNAPPMGLRLRLKASYNISSATGKARIVLEALKKYGMILADNGTSWYITGAADAGWSNSDLDQLKSVPGTAFEAVNTGPILP